MRHNPSQPQSPLDPDRLAAEQARAGYSRSLEISQRCFEIEKRKRQIRIEVFLSGADTYRALCPCERMNPRQGWSILRRLAVVGEFQAAYVEVQLLRGDCPYAMSPPRYR